MKAGFGTSTQTPITGSGDRRRAMVTGTDSHGPASHHTPSASWRGGKKSGTAMLRRNASTSGPLVMAVGVPLTRS